MKLITTCTAACPAWLLACGGTYDGARCPPSALLGGVSAARRSARRTCLLAGLNVVIALQGGCGTQCMQGWPHQFTDRGAINVAGMQSSSARRTRPASLINSTVAARLFPVSSAMLAVGGQSICAVHKPRAVPSSSSSTARHTSAGSSSWRSAVPGAWPTGAAAARGRHRCVALHPPCVPDGS